MNISISQELCRRLINDCYTKLPQESCGMLLGTIKGNHLEVKDFIPISNRSNQPNQHFVMDSQEWVEQWNLTLHNSKEIIGIYHSHPSTPAIPSLEDLTTLWHTLPSYWIISLMNPKAPEVCAYSLFPSTAKNPQHDCGNVLLYEKIPYVLK